VDVYADDMARQTLPDASNPRAGLSPLNAAFRDIQSDDERVDFFLELMKNNKVPGLTLTVPGEGTSEDQLKMMRAMLIERFGRGNRGGPMILMGGTTAKQTEPMKELDWEGASAQSETRICAAYGVPPMLLNLRAGHDASTFANFKESKRACYEGTVSKYWTLFGHFLTKVLITDEGMLSDREIYFNTDEVAALHEDQDAKSDRAIKEFTAGIRTLGESREVIGLDPVSKDQDGYRRDMSYEITNGARAEAAPIPTDDGAKAGEPL